MAKCLVDEAIDQDPQLPPRGSNNYWVVAVSLGYKAGKRARRKVTGRTKTEVKAPAYGRPACGTSTVVVNNAASRAVDRASS
jgi:hypothetical protein